MDINKQLKVCTCLCPSLKKTTTRFPNIFVRRQIQKIGKLNKLTGFCCKTKRSKQELKLSKVKTKRSKQELKSSKAKPKRSKQDSYNHLRSKLKDQNRKLKSSKVKTKRSKQEATII